MLATNFVMPEVINLAELCCWHAHICGICIATMLQLRLKFVARNLSNHLFFDCIQYCLITLVNFPKLPLHLYILGRDSNFGTVCLNKAKLFSIHNCTPHCCQHRLCPNCSSLPRRCVICPDFLLPIQAKAKTLV